MSNVEKFAVIVDTEKSITGNGAMRPLIIAVSNSERPRGNRKAAVALRRRR